MTASKAKVAGAVVATKSQAALLARIQRIWESARTQAARSVNTAHVCANLVDRSADRGGRSSWRATRRLIHHALRDESAAGRAWRPGQLNAGLSWTHYRALLRVERREMRDFYEIESVRNGWSARQLERQIDSFLFERLAKSRDKTGVLALANEGQALNRPQDAIKDPYVLEFLDLPESHRLVESRIEEALINQLQDFLLELGSGFAFIGRQKRLTLDGDHFYPDLVFYHIKLKCYVIIDLKVGRLAHGDIGQMQLYVNYYDREIAAKGDNPTIGLLLCSEKNDAVVRYVLPQGNEQIFASRYQFALPSEEDLRAEIRRELEQIGQMATPAVAPKRRVAAAKKIK